MAWIKRINVTKMILHVTLKWRGKLCQQLLKKEQSPKGLSLSSKKLNEITIKPEVKDGKVLLDKKNKDHCYIMEKD